MESLVLSTNLALACSAYVVGTASPGPSNLAIMATAMQCGRRPALTLALGVVSGSVFWGLLVAFGLSALLAAWSGALVAMKILGGLYLLYLGIRSARAAMSSTALASRAGVAAASALRLYLRGTAMHLTNPKAILVWLSMVSLALPPGARTSDALAVVLVCSVLGLVVFCGYAIAFSTERMRRTYRSLRRWFEGTLAVVFACAGVRMLASAR